MSRSSERSTIGNLSATLACDGIRLAEQHAGNDDQRGGPIGGRRGGAAWHRQPDQRYRRRGRHRKRQHRHRNETRRGNHQRPSPTPAPSTPIAARSTTASTNSTGWARSNRLAARWSPRTCSRTMRVASWRVISSSWTIAMLTNAGTITIGKRHAGDEQPQHHRDGQCNWGVSSTARSQRDGGAFNVTVGRSPATAHSTI